MKGFLFVFFLLLTIQITFSQKIDFNRIQQVDISSLSDNEILEINQFVISNAMTEYELEQLLITNNVSPDKTKLLSERLKKINPLTKEKTIISNLERDVVNNKETISFNETTDHLKPHVFGSEIFNNVAMSFEPNTNMITPANYILGKGDELQIVVYGMQEYAQAHSIDKEGRLSIPVVGQIFVGGLTIEAARVKIKNAFSKVYRSLNSNQSSISISLSKIRTIQITIIGAKKSGNYSVSSLSTVFNALHIAGGPNEKGSYRDIELIRNNKVLKVIDLYAFLIKGDQSGNINLIENDVIRIPVYKNRITIEGPVKKPGIFEFKEKETISDIFEYSGGFEDNAYNQSVKLVENFNDGTKVKDLNVAQFSNYIPQTGNKIIVREKLNYNEQKVTIKGAVNRPDFYEYKVGMTLNDLITLADGLSKDAYLNKGIIIREKKDLSKEIIDINLDDLSNSIVLNNKDEIIINSKSNLKSEQFVEISGEVKNPGNFMFIDNIRLYDLIILSGGLTDASSRTLEISSRINKDEKVGSSTKKTDLFVLEFDTLLIDQSKNILLKPYDQIRIRKKPYFNRSNVVSITGEVEYPGLYTLSDVNEKVYDIIKRAGGLNGEADLSSIRIVRNKSTKILDSLIIEEVIIPIEYNFIINNIKSKKNIFLHDGDKIIISKKKNTIHVAGEVQLNTEIPFTSNRLKYYVSSAGGFTKKSDKKRAYVIKSNGIAKSTKSFLGIKIYPKITPGASVFIPLKNNEKEGLTTTELAILGSFFTSVTTSVIAILNLSK